MAKNKTIAILELEGLVVCKNAGVKVFIIVYEICNNKSIKVPISTKFYSTVQD